MVLGTYFAKWTPHMGKHNCITQPLLLPQISGVYYEGGSPQEKSHAPYLGSTYKPLFLGKFTYQHNSSSIQCMTKYFCLQKSVSQSVTLWKQMLRKLCLLRGSEGSFKKHNLLKYQTIIHYIKSIFRTD